MYHWLHKTWSYIIYYPPNNTHSIVTKLLAKLRHLCKNLRICVRIRELIRTKKILKRGGNIPLALYSNLYIPHILYALHSHAAPRHLTKSYSIDRGRVASPTYAVSGSFLSRNLLPGTNYCLKAPQSATFGLTVTF